MGTFIRNIDLMHQFTRRAPSIAAPAARRYQRGLEHIVWTELNLDGVAAARVSSNPVNNCVALMIQNSPLNTNFNPAFPHILQVRDGGLNGSTFLAAYRKGFELLPGQMLTIEADRTDSEIDFIEPGEFWLYVNNAGNPVNKVQIGIGVLT